MQPYIDYSTNPLHMYDDPIIPPGMNVIIAHPEYYETELYHNTMRRRQQPWVEEMIVVP
jgi:hypothetical protein